MVITKKLSLMVNNMFLKLMLLLCLLIFISCDGVQTKEVNEIGALEKQDEFIESVQEVKFLPDSTVNQILILNHVESAVRFYSNISSEEYINYLRESPVLGFCNKGKDEYLLLYQYEGGVKNGFSCFEIGNINDLGKGVTALDYESFKTESGLMLGMSLEELVDIKGKPYNQNGDKVIYQLTDYPNSSFLKRYNMPAYFLECTLKDDRVIRIKYGFNYP